MSSWPSRVLASSAGALLALAPLPGGLKTSPLAVTAYVPSTAHQAYGYELAQTLLSRNARGRAWLDAADAALLAPQTVTSPVELDAEFAPDTVAAHGYAFEIGAARRVQIELRMGAQPIDAGEELFIDVFRVGERGRVEHVQSAPPASPIAARSSVARIDLETIEADRFVLRVQPTLGGAGRYALSLASSALLAFPVDGHDTRAIQSGFGAQRDGGARSHRGVDIFAPRGTPALAAMDGWVARVESTPRGGNVVWLQALFGNFRLYYAHLDTQLVERGEFVRVGQPIGTIGNTGNARTTPPHLHFGVYARRRGMRGGARDPYPFLE